MVLEPEKREIFYMRFQSQKSPHSVIFGSSAPRPSISRACVVVSRPADKVRAPSTPPRARPAPPQGTRRAKSPPRSSTEGSPERTRARTRADDPRAFVLARKAEPPIVGVFSPHGSRAPAAYLPPPHARGRHALAHERAHGERWQELIGVERRGRRGTRAVAGASPPEAAL